MGIGYRGYSILGGQLILHTYILQLLSSNLSGLDMFDVIWIDPLVTITIRSNIAHTPHDTNENEPLKMILGGEMLSQLST